MIKVRNTLNKKELWVYVYRDTIEKGYSGEDNLARVLVKKEWLEEYVKETSKYRDLSNWWDFYIADETVELYDKAKEAGAVLKVEYGKPAVIEKVTRREKMDLPYEAMRMLEIIGKPEEVSKMFSDVNKLHMPYSYSDVKEVIKRYVDVKLETYKSNIRVGTSLNVYSVLNPWIDFIVNVGAYADVEKTQEIIEHAFTEWFEDNDKVGDSTVMEYISEKLKAENIDFEIYVKMEEAEEE